MTVTQSRQCLGSFATAEEAHAAYLRAKAELHAFQTIVTTKEVECSN